MVKKAYRKKIAVAVMTAALMIGGSVIAEEPENEALPEAAPAETIEMETPAPQTEAPAPQTEAPAPQTEAPAPQTEAPAPQTEAPAPETEAPAPQTEAPAPETEAPAPQTEAPAPQTEAPAPQTEAPAPETEAPAPETEAPAPQTEAPAPETEAPAPETEAPAPQTETPASETEAQAPETVTIPEEEVPMGAAPETEAEQDSQDEAEETEKKTFKTDFYYENDEVIVTVKALKEAQLPEDTVMNVRKLQEGTAEYNAAKQAAEAKTGVSQTARYRFYDVSFLLNGKELNPVDGTVFVKVQFKTIQVNTSAKTQKVLQIRGGGASDVTAAGAQGSRMSSVDFAL